MHKKRWYVLAGCAAVLWIGVVSVLNTTWLTVSVVRNMLASRPGIVLRRVHIDHQHFSLPGRLVLYDVDLAFEINGKMLTAQAPQVVLTGLQTWGDSDRRILVAAQGIMARYDPGGVKNARVDLTMARDGMSGPVIAAEGNWDKLRVRDVSLFLHVNASGVELRAVKLAAYGGHITGKVFVDTAKKSALRYAADFFVEGLDVSRLAEINPDIESSLNGVVEGTVKVAGDAASVRTMDTDLAMPMGGKISAALLSALIQYLPQSREKKRLELLIRKGEKVALEAFSFTMKGAEAGKFSGDIRLRSREINLELNLEHEINTDGTVSSLLEYWEKFLK